MSDAPNAGASGGRTPVGMGRTVLTGLAACLLTCAAHAQQAQVRASASPHYAGVPIEIQVAVDGLEREPEPTIDVEPPSGAALELRGVSPNVSSSISIVNGRMTRRDAVQFVYSYRLVAPRAGEVVVGPFRITQGGTTLEARAVRFAIEGLPDADEHRLRLVLPDGPLWVGQRVPVALEWWLPQDFARRLAGRRARVPLFDLLDRFTFEDREPGEGQSSTLAVDTAAGELALPMTVRREQWQGKTYLVATVERTLIALRPGEVTVEPATLVAEEGVRWSRDFFGNRVPASVRRIQVADEPRTLVFEPPPAAGRPASFSGAVGKGFSIEVTADRSVVQTGDPITLAIEVRGDTALDTVSLPRLADSGLDPRDFTAPDGPIAGTVANGVKRFEVAVRANHEDVSEIPPVALSWLDPDSGRYETTRSRPIALSVGAATVVSAADVVTGEATPSAEQAAVEPVPDSPAERPAFTLSGAELAIETRSDRLLARAAPWHTHPVALAAFYLAGAASIAMALVARRRAGVDPAVRERQRVLATARRAVADAPGAGDVARALRRMAAASPPARREEYEALLDECDNLHYAPGAGDGAAVDQTLRERALAVADAMVEAAR